jgi:hypothetical protein
MTVNVYSAYYVIKDDWSYPSHINLKISQGIELSPDPVFKLI